MIRVLAILFLVCLPLRAATSFQIVTATNPDKALTYVISGDGFSSANQAGWLAVATNIAYALTNGTTQNWIGTNANRFNIHVVQTNSAVNGNGGYSSAHSDTPFGGYISGGFCYVDANDHLAIVQEVGLFNVDFEYLVVLNRGDALATTLSGRIVLTTNSNMNITIHETGHLVADLGDEYSGEVNGDVGKVNVAGSLTSATNQWLNTFAIGSPVSVDASFVPTATCKLGSDISQSFCVVCSNEFVRVLQWTNYPTASASPFTIRTGTFRIR